MTTRRLESEVASERWSDARIDTWDLCVEFVQVIVAEASSAAVKDGSGEIPDVDWAAIWRAGDGAPSDEAAIGRVVRAAWKAARGISSLPSHDELLPPRSPHSSNRAAVVAGVPTAISTEMDADTIVIVEPLVQPQEPAAVPVEPFVAPSDSVPVPAEPAASVDEALMTPVSAATAVVDPAIVERSEPTMAEVDVAQAEGSSIVRPALEEEPLVGEDVGLPDAVKRPSTLVHSPWYNVFTWTRNVGAIILLFVAWQLWGTSISQHHAQSQLKSEFNALQAHDTARSHGSKASLVSAATRVPSPGNGTVVAEIQIPAIGVNQYVVEGTTESDLSKGPGHYIGTAMPGQAGNVAIVGHRTTNGAPFNGLGRLVPGDRIILTTTSGRNLTYAVSGTPQAVSPRDVGVLNYFGDNRITLTTCNPEFSSSQRLVAVGMLKRPLAGPAADVKHLSYHVVNAATASWNWSLLPAFGVEVCLLLLLALSYRRIGTWFGSNGKWVILVPLWAAGLYILFGTLTNFLPAAL